MRILVCGASGFVGRHLLRALQAAGHECVRGVRRPAGPDDIAIDYTRDTSVDTWVPRLAGIDVVVNAIGVLRDTRKTPMRKIFGEAPAALFEACARAGIKRVINISALGVGGPVDTEYFRCKRMAEVQLEALSGQLCWLNLRPSLIHGPDGSSTAMFMQLARLPLHALPMGGVQMFQPVHVGDLALACVNWLADPQAASMHVDAVGATPCSMRTLLDSYRVQMGKAPAWHVAVPGVFIRLGARCGDYLSFSPLCTDNLAMLQAGSTAPADGFAALLGRAPVSYQSLLEHDQMP